MMETTPLNSLKVLYIHHQIEEVPVEVIRVSLFFKKKLMVLMIDMSMACTVSKFSNMRRPLCGLC